MQESAWKQEWIMGYKIRQPKMKIISWLKGGRILNALRSIRAKAPDEKTKKSPEKFYHIPRKNHSC